MQPPAATESVRSSLLAALAAPCGFQSPANPTAFRRWLFKQKTLDQITLNARQTLSLGRILMEVGDGPATVINVTAEAALVTENAVRSETVQAKQVTNMPLNGRNWTTLMKISAPQGGHYGIVQGCEGRGPVSSHRRPVFKIAHG